MSYPHVVDEHLVKADWTQAALHNVGNGTRSHN